MKHTLGPLTTGSGKFSDQIFSTPTPDGDDWGENLICETDGHTGNAQHLVDCWNACEGINPKVVPGLLETLEQAERVFNTSEINPMKAFLMIEKMRHFIAKAKAIKED